MGEGAGAVAGASGVNSILLLLLSHSLTEGEKMIRSSAPTRSFSTVLLTITTFPLAIPPIALAVPAFIWPFTAYPKTGVNPAPDFIAPGFGGLYTR